jgi:rhodanese-related sulfurtransferase
MKRKDTLTLLATAAAVLGATLAIAGTHTDRLQRRANPSAQALATPDYWNGLGEHRFQVSAATLRAWMSGSTPPLLIDVRAQTAFAAGHVPGAIARPFDDLLAGGPGVEVVGRQVVLYDQDGRLAPYLVCPLRARGVDAYMVAGGYAAWFGLTAKRPAPTAASGASAESVAVAPTTAPPPASAPPPAATAPPPSAGAPPASAPAVAGGGDDEGC